MENLSADGGDVVELVQAEALKVIIVDKESDSSCNKRHNYVAFFVCVYIHIYVCTSYSLLKIKLDLLLLSHI